MGLIIKKVALTNYVENSPIYSKLIRNNLNFYIETHYLDKGQTVQLFIYRNHPRIKEFIGIKHKLKYMTEQRTSLSTQAQQIKVSINNDDFMLSCGDKTQIDIQEFNYNKTLEDCNKGKIAVLITFHLAPEIDNSKFITDVKNFYKKENNNNEE